MATVEQACLKGNLIEYSLPEWATQDVIRKVFIHPDFMENWADVEPLLHDEKKGSGGRTRFEHLEILLVDLRCAKRPDAGDIRRMLPHEFGVIRFQPEKMRIFGFVTKTGQIVILEGVTKEATLKDSSLTDKVVKKCRDFIVLHELQDEVFEGKPYEIKDKINKQ